MVSTFYNLHDLKDDVESYMAREGNEDASKVIARLEEQHHKYRFMESNLMAKKKRIKKQVPDLESSLATLKELIKAKEQEKELQTKFLLSHHVYMNARVPPTDKVCLWLGVSYQCSFL